MHLLFVLLMGMLVSFLGALPLGNLNLAATQLSVQENFSNAWKFGIGAALVEVIYLRFALTGVDWVMQHQTLFTILGWVTVIIFFILGLAGFMAARKKEKDKKGILLNNTINRFFLGITMSALNPAQLPFWFVWSTYLINNTILQPVSTEYNYFTVGAGMGTLAGMALYIHGGNWLILKLKTSNKTLNYIMGAIFILTALIQLYKMIFEPAMV